MTKVSCDITLVMAVQGAAKKAQADKTEAARKEIAELMAKAKADMDKDDKKGGAKAAQSQADELQKEVLPLLPSLYLIMSDIYQEDWITLRFLHALQKSGNFFTTSTCSATVCASSLLLVVHSCSRNT